MLRRLLEFSSNAFISVLTKTQSIQIKKCQNKALKIIFGYDHSNEDLLKKAELSKIMERRRTLMKNLR